MAHIKPEPPPSAAPLSAAERLQLALDAGGMGTFIWHVAENRCEPDARMLAHFGVDDGAKLNLRDALAELIYPEDRERYELGLDRAVDPNGSGELREDIRILQPGASERWITVFGCTAFAGEPRMAFRMAGLTADSSERKRAERALRESEHRLRVADLRKDEYLAMLGHELRNPLAAIKGGLELLQSDRVQEATRQSTMPVVVAQVLHMERLIEDTLDVARFTHGKIVVRLEPATLQTILHEALLMIEAQVRSRGCRLSVELADAPIELMADSVRLVQVFSNLLSNAVRYSDQGGLIELDARQEAMEAVVRLRDYGLGIDPELLPRIFEPFVQSSSSRSRTDGGLGLGLSVVRQLVELHGGGVVGYSAGIGFGSEFVVRLPLKEAAP
jgi:signal transduction histidine kinase